MFTKQINREASENIPNNSLFLYGKQEIERSKGLKKLILKIVSYHFYVQLLYEIHLIKIRIKHHIKQLLNYKTPTLPDNAFVNLGCGESGLEGWINVDTHWNNNVSLVYDIRKHLPLSTNSTPGIFTEHFVEHLDYSEEIPFFLSECHRILKPDGVLRIVVPDAGKYLNGYCQSDWELIESTRPLNSEHIDKWYGQKINTKMEMMNVVFRQGIEHKFAYDAETLCYVLEKFGFKDVKQQHFQEGYISDLCIDRESRQSESLYVEGRK